MTPSFDAQRYQHALERWRALAESRLAHISDLYETGRWQLYFSERDFLATVRAARVAAETWQRLVPDAPQLAEVVELTTAPPYAETPLPQQFYEAAATAA
jgi:uncharacterized repeat protein (TIGR03809 family)